MNFAEKAQQILIFGESGRDNWSYRYQLLKLAENGKLTQQDYADFAALGENGTLILNKFLREYRKNVQYA